MVTDQSGHPRLPSIDERVRLHCLREGHTLGALRSSEAKQNPKLDFNVRVSMIGDGYQHLVTTWLFGNLAAQLGYLTRAPSFEEIRDRRVYPLLVTRTAQVWAGVRLRWEASLPARLSRWLLARVDARGSDIRLCTGELMKPHRVLREGINPRLWHWRSQMSWAWRRADAHINELKSIAVLVQLKARARKSGNFNTVFLHLVDSQVALGVFMKRRSSSRLLQRVWRRANALCLACNLQTHRRGASLAKCRMPKYERSNEERRAQRAGKGSLKERQIGKRCVPRYAVALRRSFLRAPYLFGIWAATWEDRDLQVSAYIELLWSEGEPRGQAGDILSSLQWHYSVRKVLPGSWRKFATWSRLEPSIQVLPLPVAALFSIVGYAVSVGDLEFAAGVYLFFHCMLRKGELLTLQYS